MSVVKLRLSGKKYYPENEFAAYLCEFASEGAFNRGMRRINERQKELLEQMGFRVELVNG